MKTMMEPYAPVGQRSGRSVAGLALVLIALIGCQSTRPDPAAEEAVAQAVALGEPLTFRVEGGPLDEPAAGDTLSFLDATRRAVVTDPGLQGALARVRMAMADADQARLLPNPVLSFILRWGAGKPNVEVTLTESIIQVFQRSSRSSAADNRLRQAAADAVGDALDVVATVQELYALVQAEDRLLPVLESRRDLLRRLTEVASNRLEAGEGVRGDVTTLDAQRVEMDIELAEAGLRRRTQRLRLAHLIGEPSGSAAWQLEPWMPPAAVATPEQVWVDLALQRRPEVQSVAWQLAALGDDYALTRLFPWEASDIGVDAQRPDGWVAGPSVSTPLPIFDTGDARRARVTAEQIEARHALTTARRRVVEEVRVAHKALAGNLVNLARVRQDLIPLRQLRRDQAEEAYRAGLTDVTPLYLAERDLGVTQSQAIEIERQATISLVRLQRAVGGPGVAAEIAK
ncbi:MAG: TolC family protein [Planctomycetes bacterium]|nr:TolC family protein [Planctomycetota bacterium]